MREQIDLFAYLPDGGLDFLIRRLHADIPDRAVMLTTEEEGVGVCCGAWLGGKRSVMAIQSSGVGNCINAFSLVTNCRFPLFLLVSMRGEFGEGNPWQIPMGSITAESPEAFRLPRVQRHPRGRGGGAGRRRTDDGLSVRSAGGRAAVATAARRQGDVKRRCERRCRRSATPRGGDGLLAGHRQRIDRLRTWLAGSGRDGGRAIGR